MVYTSRRGGNGTGLRPRPPLHDACILIPYPPSGGRLERVEGKGCWDWMKFGMSPPATPTICRPSTPEGVEAFLASFSFLDLYYYCLIVVVIFPAKLSARKICVHSIVPFPPPLPSAICRREEVPTYLGTLIVT